MNALTYLIDQNITLFPIQPSGENNGMKVDYYTKSQCGLYAAS